MEHPLAEFDPEIPGKFLVLLIDCDSDTEVVTLKSDVPTLVILL